MTHAEAMDAIRRLAGGLGADDAGVRRLLERVSLHDDAECLRDALTEFGAEALLDQEDRRTKEGDPCVSD